MDSNGTDVHTIHGKEVFQKTVKKQGSSGVIYVPLRYFGKNVVVVVV